jgi:two-component system OmpR family response regulator
LNRGTVLVAAADIAFRAEIARLLRSAGYTAELAEGAKRAREIAAKTRLDLAIVAAEQLGADGLGLAHELREILGAVLILAQPPEAERLGGAFPGAVVRLSPATNLAELLGPIEQAIARAAARSETPAPLLCFDGWTLDPGGRTLFDDEERDVALTDHEFRLLVDFARHAGRVRTREQLREAIGGRDIDAFDRSVDMQVSRLRRKIEENPKQPRLILTVPGAGYKFGVRVEPIEAAAPPRVPEAAPERRFLTILSCRFAGLPALADRLDPASVCAATAALRRTCCAIARGFGGFVQRFVGDGFTAYFGYPELREDDTLRAIRAGIALIGSTNRPERWLPAGLRPRIGIAAGAAVVGDLGERGPAAVGAAPQIAARLNAAAQGDWVVVEPNARRRVGGFFAFVPLEPIVVEGIGEPIQAWRVQIAL